MIMWHLQGKVSAFLLFKDIIQRIDIRQHMDYYIKENSYKEDVLCS